MTGNLLTRQNVMPLVTPSHLLGAAEAACLLHGLQQHQIQEGHAP